MPQRNGPRSSRGRAAIARRVMFGGASPTNGMMPRVQVMTAQGKMVTTSYFWWSKEGWFSTKCYRVQPCKHPYD